MTTALFEIVPSHHRDSAEHTPGAIEAAVIETIEELEKSGQLVGKYKAISVALLSTARAVDDGLLSPKVTTATANLTQRLFESLDKLPEPKIDRGNVFDTLEATISSLTAVALKGEAS